MDRPGRDESLNARESGLGLGALAHRHDPGRRADQLLLQHSRTTISRRRAALRWLKAPAVLDCSIAPRKAVSRGPLDNVETRAEVISAWSDDDAGDRRDGSRTSTRVARLFEGLEEKLDRYVMEDPRDDDLVPE